MAICNSLRLGGHPLSEVEHRFDYYNQQGKLLNQSIGKQPDVDLFDQAYYVVSNQTRMLKNLDSRSIIQHDIECFRQELIATPISNISSIMDINNAIRALSQFLETSDPINAS